MDEPDLLVSSDVAGLASSLVATWRFVAAADRGEAAIAGLEAKLQAIDPAALAERRSLWRGMVCDSLRSGELEFAVG